MEPVRTGTKSKTTFDTHKKTQLSFLYISIHFIQKLNVNLFERAKSFFLIIHRSKSHDKY
jgi:hypothetical protein